MNGVQPHKGNLFDTITLDVARGTAAFSEISAATIVQSQIQHRATHLGQYAEAKGVRRVGVNRPGRGVTVRRRARAIGRLGGPGCRKINR